MNLAHLLVRRAMRHPERAAVAVGSRVCVTYGQLASRAGSIATALIQDLGLARGGRVVLFMTNCPEYLEVLYGCWIAGLAAVPVNARLHARELEFILQDTEASVLFVTKDLADVAAQAAAATRTRIIVIGSKDYAKALGVEPMATVNAAPEELAWIFYTSGTTGRPKGAMLSHRNLLTMALSYQADIDPLGEDDTILHAAPMSHGSGLYSVQFMMQGGLQVIPSSGHFDADTVRETLSAYRNVTFFAAPTMVKRLVTAERRPDLHNLKTIVYGGAPMYVQDCREALRCLGPRLVQIYGQGESPMTITALSRQVHMDAEHPLYLDRLGSVGVARTGVEVRIADEEGQPLPAGETGEVLVRGDTVMVGYWNNPEASAKALTDGWLHTGDIGVLDADGFLTLKDRSKDVIISGGSNIYPREVEEVLLRHPAIAEVSVVGWPHPEWGEQVVAFVVAKPGSMPQTEELDRLCLDHIARFKRPRHYVFIDALPKNNYGKVLKRVLREQFAQAGDAKTRQSRPT